MFYVRSKSNNLFRLVAPGGRQLQLHDNVGGFAVTADARWALIEFLPDKEQEDPFNPVIPPLTILDLNLDKTEPEIEPERTLPDPPTDCRINVRHPTDPEIICFGESRAPPTPLDPVKLIKVIDLEARTSQELPVRTAGDLRFHRFDEVGRRLLAAHPSSFQLLDLESGTAHVQPGLATTAIFLPGDETLVVSLVESDPLDPERVVARLALFDTALNLLGHASPPGHTVDNYGTTTDATGAVWLVFSARILDEPPDLMATRLPLAEGPRLLATGVRKFGFGNGRVIALVEVSTQDRTGFLELFDLPLGTQETLATSVLDFSAAAPDCPGCQPLASGTPLGFVVRTRSERSVDGLWLHRLP